MTTKQKLAIVFAVLQPLIWWFIYLFLRDTALKGTDNALGAACIFCYIGSTLATLFIAFADGQQ